MFTEYKSALHSKGVWGGAVAISAGLAGVLGYTVTPADQVQIVNLAAGVVSAVKGLSLGMGRLLSGHRTGMNQLFCLMLLRN